MTIMKLIAIAACGLALFFCTQTMGQVSRSDGMIDLSNDLAHTLVEQIPFNPITTEGTHYYSDEWEEGEIELNNGSFIKGFTLKYDIENDELQINAQSKIRTLDGLEVNRFTILHENRSVNFINAMTFTLEGTPLTGFFEVVADGKYKLLSKLSISMKKATYNLAIDMGTEENVITKVETLYLATESQLNKLSKNKKKTLVFFGNSAEAIEQYAKTNGLGFRKKERLNENL